MRNLTLFLSYVVPVKSKVKILQNFVAFSKYMNCRQEEATIDQNKHIQNQGPRMDSNMSTYFRFHTMDQVGSRVKRSH